MKSRDKYCSKSSYSTSSSASNSSLSSKTSTSNEEGSSSSSNTSILWKNKSYSTQSSTCPTEMHDSMNSAMGPRKKFHMNSCNQFRRNSFTFNEQLGNLSDSSESCPLLKKSPNASNESLESKTATEQTSRTYTATADKNELQSEGTESYSTVSALSSDNTQGNETDKSSNGASIYANSDEKSFFRPSSCASLSYGSYERSPYNRRKPVPSKDELSPHEEMIKISHSELRQPLETSSFYSRRNQRCTTRQTSKSVVGQTSTANKNAKQNSNSNLLDTIKIQPLSYDNNSKQPSKDTKICLHEPANNNYYLTKTSFDLPSIQIMPRMDDGDSSTLNNSYNTSSTNLHLKESLLMLGERDYEQSSCCSLKNCTIAQRLGSGQTTDNRFQLANGHAHEQNMGPIKAVSTLSKRKMWAEFHKPPLESKSKSPVSLCWESEYTFYVRNRTTFPALNRKSCPPAPQNIPEYLLPIPIMNDNEIQKFIDIDKRKTNSVLALWDNKHAYKVAAYDKS